MKNIFCFFSACLSIFYSITLQAQVQTDYGKYFKKQQHQPAPVIRTIKKYKNDKVSGKEYLFDETQFDIKGKKIGRAHV